jgi:hypothetical protein
MGRALAILLIATVWMAFGVAVYVYLGAHRSTLAARAKKPGEEVKAGPITRLPGTLYLAQAGALYRLQGGVFTEVLSAPGGASAWTQPSFMGDGRLLVVRKDYASSDIYEFDPRSGTRSQMTHNASRVTESNHWAFYPRLSPDGSSLFFSYDRKDPNSYYNVVLSVYAMPVGGSFNQARRWTLPANYTGGDLEPVPLHSGGVVYTKYSFDEKTNKILSQIYLTTRIQSPGKPLTPLEDDCSQPALSSDGSRLAMVCTGGKQFADVEVASFDGSKLGDRQVLASGQLASQPTWAPDGSGLVYLAPQGPSGHFQLWLQAVPAPAPPPTAAPVPTRSPARGAQPTKPTATPAASPTPTVTPPPIPPPVQLTNDLDFDATSTIAWHS